MKFNTKKISIVTTLLALFSLSACGPAFLPTEFDSKNLNSQLLLKSPFTCNPRSVRTESKLKRLTKNEYVNTIIDLFPSAIISDSNVKTALDNIPEENSSLAYESFASQYDRSSIERYISTSEAISLAITQTAARQNLVFPTCFESQPMTTLCFNSFMDSFGLRAFRRPLSQIEKDIYLELYKEREATDQTLAIRGLMVSILLSPQFLYKLEFNGAPVENEENLVEIDEFELASRLSFYLWGSMPDNELYEAAKSGQLKTDEGYQRQVKRMLGHSKTTAKFKMFYSKWLKLSDIPGLTAYSQSFANGIELNTELKEDMLEEIDNLISDVVWKTNGSFSDLFATRKVYSQSQSLLKIYGVNGQNPNEFTLGQRAGLLNRAAFLVTGSDDTSPFIRGYRILEDVLCRTLPRPDQLNDFDPSLLEEPPVEAEISTRERFHRRTNSGTCMGCHSQFNPLGFALGHYDGLGRYNQLDRIFIEGIHVGDHPVDASAQIRFSGQAEVIKVENGAQLSQAIGRSSEGMACFSRQWYRFTFGFEENLNQDACDLETIFEGLNGDTGSIIKMIESTVYSKRFRNRSIVSN